MGAARVKSRPSNLPAELSSFVGRRRELSEVKRLLSTTRLLTLTGSGGVGKTRLALRAAAEMARSFPHGVWLVSLASIDDPQLVVQAVFSALGLQDMSSGLSLSTLSRYLADRHLLLVLDNCEHLLDGCAVLAVNLLRSCPELRVLTTSRQALGVTGETRLRVPPLSLPEDGASLAPEHLATYEAVALLSERAVAVQPDFKVDQANSAAVLRLCRRLDGLPLALELAAVQLEGLTVEQVLHDLEGELHVLANRNRGAEARQQTLEATIGWSYGLLDEKERRLWARLSVFAGGFDEEAAAAVCSDEQLPADRIPALLGALVEKSIVKRVLSIRPARYFLLETLRQYGWGRLVELNEESEIRTRHRDWILGLAAAAGAWDSRQADIFNRISLERDNLWSALDFCLHQPGEGARGVEICRHLYAYWLCRHVLSDPRRVVESLIEQTPPESLARAQGLWVAATLAVMQNDYEAAGRMLAESLRLGRTLRDDDVVAWSLIYLSILDWAGQRTAEALSLVESGLALARALDNRQAMMGALNHLLVVRSSMGEIDDRVLEIGAEAQAISEAAGEQWVRAMLLDELGQVRWLRGETETAITLTQQALTHITALDDHTQLPIALDNLASMEAERGAALRAATLLGCAEGIREAVGAPVFEPYRAQHERTESLARESLGEAAFTAAIEHGRTMTIDEAVAYAVDDTHQRKPAPPAKADSRTTLTRREMEIARLIAEGLTSQQISTRLFISERTVTTHVTNMLNKLGLSSRIQLASWVAGDREQAGSRDT